MRGTVDVGSECVKQQYLAKLDILQQSGWTALKAIFTKACSPNFKSTEISLKRWIYIRFITDLLTYSGY